MPRISPTFARAGAGAAHAPASTGCCGRNMREFAMEYPVTTEIPLDDPAYAATLKAFYEDCVEKLLAMARAGRNVVVLCEGDPFFYGSFTASAFPPPRPLPGGGGARHYRHVRLLDGDGPADHLWRRRALRPRGARSKRESLVARMREADALVVMKLGRNLPKVPPAPSSARGSLNAPSMSPMGRCRSSRWMPLSQKGNRRRAIFLDDHRPRPGAAAMKGRRP